MIDEQNEHVRIIIPVLGKSSVPAAIGSSGKLSKTVWSQIEIKREPEFLMSGSEYL